MNRYELLSKKCDQNRGKSIIYAEPGNLSRGEAKFIDIVMSQDIKVSGLPKL